MKKRLISFDWAMKSILRNKANSGILNGLLSELLGRKVIVQKILESESNCDREGGKTNKLDLKAQIDDGEIAIFEMQVGKQRDFFHRVLFGTSKAVVEQLDKGDDYEKIKKVYSVDIVYFELGRGEDYIYHGVTDFRGIHDNKSLLLSEKEMEFLPQYIRESKNAGGLFPEYYLIYPDKFDERIRSRFDEWVYAFKTSTVESGFTAAGIQEMGEALDVRMMTEAERIAYEDYLKYERVRSSEITTALADGRASGREEGRAEGRAEGMAEVFKLIEQGVPLNEVKKILGIF
ncbi:MAG: Rpn family recombination-promoting nuclease/putative transposase [Chitinispirillales bacterium]|jgi:predicted transposase/invertase (TIGR01784 family)|nr:Rpn family recombination-promoting nuclease/putative transposase [Chitinispirillales bacterium]